MRAFFTNSSFSALAIETIRRYRRQFLLNQPLVEPLFYTCWMYLALKEATRLQPAALARGRFANLLKTCIAQRRTPKMNSFFDRISGTGPTALPTASNPEVT
jgi:hypothetical protein